MKFLLLALMVVPVRAFAINDCEYRLDLSYTALTLKALDQGQITTQQVVEAARANRPVNPLAAASPVAANASMIKVYNSFLSMSDEAWAAEKAKLAKVIGKLSLDRQAAHEARVATKNVLAPHFLAGYQFDRTFVRWGALDGRLFIAAVKGNRLAIFEVGKSEPVWSEVYEFNSYSRWWFDSEDGLFHFFRAATFNPGERAMHPDAKKYRTLVLDPRTLQETRDTVFLKKSESIPVNETDKGPRLALDTRHGDDFPDSSVRVIWDGRRPDVTLPFRGRTLGASTWTELTNGRKFFAMCSVYKGNVELLVFEPFVSTTPIFTYLYPYPDRHADWKIRNFLVEYEGNLLLIFDRAGGNTDFFYPLQSQERALSMDLTAHKDDDGIHIVDGKYLVNHDFQSGSPTKVNVFQIFGTGG